MRFTNSCFLDFAATSEMESSVNVQKWRKLRSRMDFYFYAGSLLIGMIFTGYFSTEYNYIDNVVQGNQTELYYSLNLGFSHVSAVLSTVICSVYYDLTMNLKATVVGTIAIVAIGNLLYALRYSVYLVICGDAMILFSTGAVVAVVAEVAHIYDEAELTAKVGVVCAFKTIGMLIGPCLALVYTRVNVTINAWILDSGNLPAVVLGSIAAIYALVSLLCAKNLAKIYDLKANRESEICNQKARDSKISDKCMEQVVENTIVICSNPKENHYPSLHEDETLDITDAPYVISFQDAQYGKGVSDLTADTMTAEVSVPTLAEKETISLKKYFWTALKLLIDARYATTLIVSVIPTYTHFLAIHLLAVVSYETLEWTVDDVSYLRLTTLG